MELNYFKDKLFDVVNENDEVDISDIEAVDRENKLYITVADGTKFVLKIELAE